MGIYFGSSHRSGIEKDEREREREGMNQALLLGFCFRSLVMVVTLQ